MLSIIKSNYLYMEINSSLILYIDTSLTSTKRSLASNEVFGFKATISVAIAISLSVFYIII